MKLSTRHSCIRGLFLLLAMGNFSVQASMLCRDSFDTVRNNMTNMNYKSFDQTPNSGWRVLYNQGCYLEAAMLIEQYKTMTGEQQASLQWHLFQNYAMAGKREQAIEVGEALLLSAKNNPAEFLWVEYIAASVAFLKEDRVTLMKMRNKLAAQADFFPNKVNLKVLDSLVDNVKSSYQAAYQQ
ncbi:hypothetical protein SIO17_16875 [Pseudoalteromonas piscicida]|uniref:Tetratricopeptide repeat protein n=1 Tax=Pseudoalteromonas piscicida TaxID=43662 RepID=A0ABM6NIQ6_PSEO7|nr:hypothetical protein [Pseudoalteromonas piscicida]ATD08743.1 hypothetical protein PPIS_a4064 [Pseudoalteromonas piscicida]WPU30741.1 hypothetical protein SIO17_16875 [Pseudoalteromonas piscicida]